VRVRASSIDDIRGGERKFLSAFPGANPEFTGGLVDLFVEHEQEFGQLYEKAFLSFMEHKLEDALNPKDRARGLYWFGDVDECDVCKRDMSGARFMIDSAVGPRGRLGCCMCAICFEAAGNRIAWGSGQLYERDERGWRLVGGARPEDNDDELT
jgi:hypothetical protein